VRPFRNAILIGTVSAVITWGVAFALMHEPNPPRMPDGSSLWVTDHGSDADLTALLWASGAYVITFTPALFFMRGRVPKNVFEKRQSMG
jgi:hypothetical protein